MQWISPDWSWNCVPLLQVQAFKEGERQEKEALLRLQELNLAKPGLDKTANEKRERRRSSSETMDTQDTPPSSSDNSLLRHQNGDSRGGGGDTNGVTNSSLNQSVCLCGSPARPPLHRCHPPLPSISLQTSHRRQGPHRCISHDVSILNLLEPLSWLHLQVLVIMAYKCCVSCVSLCVCVCVCVCVCMRPTQEERLQSDFKLHDYKTRALAMQRSQELISRAWLTTWST